MIIPRSYFHHREPFSLARELVGKYLFTKIGGQISGGIITETEICTEAMMSESIVLPHLNSDTSQDGYVYVFAYDKGKYRFGLMTKYSETQTLILVCSILSTHGEELMLKRTGKFRMSSSVTQGVENVTKALGITVEHHGHIIPSEMIWIEDRG